VNNKENTQAYHSLPNYFCSRFCSQQITISQNGKADYFKNIYFYIISIVLFEWQKI